MMPNTPPEPLVSPAPPAPSEQPPRYARPMELGAMGTVLLVDQVSKAIVRNQMPLWDHRELIPGVLNLVHVQNSGAAFGLLNNVDFPYKPAVMIAMAALALVAIAAYATQLGFHERVARLGLALILGGAFGNLVDRALRGHVVDFVDLYWGSTHFWAFNVADAAISIGAILVLLDMIGLGRQHAPDTV